LLHSATAKKIFLVNLKAFCYSIYLQI